MEEGEREKKEEGLREEKEEGEREKKIRAAYRLPAWSPTAVLPILEAA